MATAMEAVAGFLLEMRHELDAADRYVVAGRFEDGAGALEDLIDLAKKAVLELDQILEAP